MRCTERQRDSTTTVITVTSTPELGDIDSNVAATVTDVLATTPGRLVLDMTLVSSLDSYELGDLVGAQQAARQRDCSVELRNVQPRVREVLVAMNLAKVFDVTTDGPAG